MWYYEYSIRKGKFIIYTPLGKAYDSVDSEIEAIEYVHELNQ